MIDSITGTLSGGALLSLFVAKEGAALWIYVLGSLIIGFLFLFLLTQIPRRFRKPLIIGITFVSGWFYFLEFMIPGTREAAPARREIARAEQAVWQARFSVNRAIAILEQEGESAPALQRVERARAAAERAIPHIQGAHAAFEPLLASQEQSVSQAQTQLRRFGPDPADGVPRSSNSGLPSEEKWGLLVAEDRLGRATRRLDQLQRGQSGLQSALEAARQAQESLQPVSLDALSVAASSLASAEAGINGASAPTEVNFLTAYKDPVFKAVLVIGAFALGLGVFSLASIHGKAIVKRRPGWINSLGFYVAMIAMASIGLIQKYASAVSPLGRISSDTYAILFFGGLSALGATMFSLVAFYIVSAAYRAFRVRSGEAALMMLSAFLVMLSLVPIGIWLTGGLPETGLLSAFRLERIGDWILKFPNTAAQRGMAFGIGVGALAMAIRIWFSLERGSYFDKQV